MKDFGETMLVGAKVILLVEGNTVGKHLHPYIESRTLRVNMYVHGGPFDEEVDFHTTKILTSLSAFRPILKDFLGNRCQLV